MQHQQHLPQDFRVGLVDAKGKDRADEPANVRQFFVASMPHQSAFGAQGKGICQQVRSPMVAGGVIRALLVAMDEWVTNGTEPPASRIPSVAKGTLVPPAAARGPGVPEAEERHL